MTGYQKDMPSSGQLRLNDPIRWLNYAEEVTIKEDGSFQVQTDVITVTPATLVFPFAQIPCLLAPGKESTIIVNTAECSRQQSHLQKDNKPYGKKLIMEVIWLTFNKSYQTIPFQVTWLTTRARLSKM